MHACQHRLIEEHLNAIGYSSLSSFSCLNILGLSVSQFYSVWYMLLFTCSFSLKMFLLLAFQDFKTVKCSEVCTEDTFISPDSFVKWDHHSHVTGFVLSLNQYCFHREVARGISGKEGILREMSLNGNGHTRAERRFLSRVIWRNKDL